MWQFAAILLTKAGQRQYTAGNEAAGCLCSQHEQNKGILVPSMLPPAPTYTCHSQQGPLSLEHIGPCTATFGPPVHVPHSPPPHQHPSCCSLVGMIISGWPSHRRSADQRRLTESCVCKLPCSITCPLPPQVKHDPAEPLRPAAEICESQPPHSHAQVAGLLRRRVRLRQPALPRADAGKRQASGTRKLTLPLPARAPARADPCAPFRVPPHGAHPAWRAETAPTTRCRADRRRFHCSGRRASAPAAASSPCAWLACGTTRVHPEPAPHPTRVARAECTRWRCCRRS